MQVLQERLEEGQAALVTIGFLGLLQAAKLTPRRVARVFFIHATADVFFCKRIYVCAQLFVQFELAPALPEHPGNTPGGNAKPIRRNGLAHHSYLRATMGSTRVARRAGT